MSHPVAEERPAVHGDALNGLRAAIADAPSPEAASQRVVDLLHDRFAHYDWVGMYWVDGSDLVLGPWIGAEATEHTRIPIGTGVCGAARRWTSQRLPLGRIPILQDNRWTRLSWGCSLF